MAYFRTCPFCGGNLDPGEKCDCQEKKVEKQSDVISFRELARMIDLQEEKRMREKRQKKEA